MPLTDLNDCIEELEVLEPSVRDCLLTLCDENEDIFSSEDNLRNLLTTFQLRSLEDSNCEKVLRTLQKDALAPANVQSKLARFLISYMRDCVSRHLSTSEKELFFDKPK